MKGWYEDGPDLHIGNQNIGGTGGMVYWTRTGLVGAAWSGRKKIGEYRDPRTGAKTINYDARFNVERKFKHGYEKSAKLWVERQMKKGASMGATAGSKKVRRQEVAKETKTCSYCPPHDGENRRKRPRPDKHKTDRKGR